MTDAELASWARKELTENILPFWMAHARHEKTGGFYGFLGNDNSGNALEPRSVVMTSRHLWAYSAAFSLLGDPAYLEMADYAFRTIMKDFIDQESGGVYWSVKSDGTPEVSKKQVYGEAFAVYALSEYGSARKLPAAVETAAAIYSLLETKARDAEAGGYVEALSRDWNKTSDLKLSDKDIDCDKSMNTNLHVMEAFTSLHRALKTVLPEAAALRGRVNESLSSLVTVTVDKILGGDNHLDLYFNRDWTQIGDVISYGHDIEASWLLWEAAEETGDHTLAAKIRPAVLRIAETALAEGFDPVTGALENEFHGGHRDRTRIWWCQAEALVGFYNAYRMTGDEKFFAASAGLVKWIEKFQKDHERGDWFWAVSPEGQPDLSQPKGGNWKTSYHNARSCMEIMNRISFKE